LDIFVVWFSLLSKCNEHTWLLASAQILVADRHDDIFTSRLSICTAAREFGILGALLLANNAGLAFDSGHIPVRKRTNFG
jgi:hypothetical protein